jgi:transposase-like protein
MGVRGYVAYRLRTRHGEERMKEREVDVDHSTIHRWTIHYRPLLAEACLRRQRPVWVSWRLDDTYVQGQGPWGDLSRAVDTHGRPIAWRLTEHRATVAALRCLKQASRWHGGPETSPLDGRDVPEAARKRSNAEHGPHSTIGQVTYGHHSVEQAQREEASLRHARTQYVAHFHHERNHQGKGNALLFPTVSPDAERAGPIQCHERLGGLLKYYTCEAA